MENLLNSGSRASMNTKKLDFRPFRAWRYHAGRVALSRVIAPPYDVISPEEREALYAKSPHNVIRLILGKEPDFYECARRHWETWSQEGILAQDPHPALYLYEQTFHHPWDSRPMKRLAIVGTLHLEGSDAVLRHEATFAGPKQDRLLLLEKTRTNLSPIFGLYQDRDKTLSSLFSSYREQPPLFEARDDQGVFHRGWAVEKEKDQALIRNILSDQKILIADGHHRFETALEYRRRMRQKFPALQKEAPFDFVMMALVAFEDEGLLVLPTHRVLRSLESVSRKSLIERLRHAFELQPTPAEKLFSELEKTPSREKVLGGYFGEEGSFLLRLKEPKRIPESKIDALLLNSLILENLAGLSGEKRERQVEYTRSSEEAIRTVREGKAEAAFLLRSPDLKEIRALADRGEMMPQKTTYFYPKLASGLFFYHHGENDGS